MTFHFGNIKYNLFSPSIINIIFRKICIISGKMYPLKYTFTVFNLKYNPFIFLCDIKVLV